MIFQGADKLLEYLKLNRGDIVKKCDQTIYTFDIECANGYIAPGSAEVMPFDYKQKPAYYNGLKKVGLCYLWQFGVDDVYFYGRELRDLIPVFDYMASRSYRSFVWVHNLSYEFHWLLNIIRFTKVFARKPHKPITADYDNLQFRCTFMLTRQKLGDVGANLGYEKLTELMDYDKLVSPASKLPRDVIRYGIRDVEIVYKYVEKMRGEYKTLQKIPLTQTGIPRVKVKALYADDWSYHVRMAKLVPRDASEYARLKVSFVGGWVHANYYYVGIILKNLVYAYDITSSYPFQMVLRKFPATPWTECEDKADFEYYINHRGFLEYMEIELVGVKSTGFNDFLSLSKVYDRVGVKSENGRIYEAERCKTIVTCIDYVIIKKSYTGEINVLRLWYSRAAYLDKRYVNFILDMYYNKVALTHTDDPVKEELRKRSKEIINSLYGMMVSALVYEEIEFKDGKWITPDWSVDDLAAYMNDGLDKLRESPYKVFQSFSAGCFVTSYARLSLFEAVSEINKDVVYHDTDSVYCIGAHRDFFDAKNTEIKKELEAMCKKRGIDPKRLHPEDNSGEPQWLGAWTCDNDEIGGEPFAEFKTLGAKRYAYRKTPESDIKITVSGVSKKYGARALKNDLNKFTDDCTFGYEACKKLIPHYNDNQPESVWRDDNGIEYKSTYQYGITLQPAQYHLGMGNFLEILLSMGSLSDRFSEMDIDDLVTI